MYTRTKNCRYIIFEIIVVLLFSGVLPQLSFAESPEIILHSDNTNYTDLEKEFYFFTDTTSKLNWKTIREMTNEFEALRDKGPFFSKENVYWAKCHIKNNNKLVSDWVLISGAKRNLSIVDVYIVYEDGSWEHKKTGQYRKISERDVKHGVESTVRLNLSFQQSVSVFIRAEVKDREGYLWRFNIKPYSAYMEMLLDRNVIQGSLITFFFLLSLFGFILYFLIGEKSYLYYGLATSCNGIFFFGDYNFLQEYFFVNHPQWFQWIWPLDTCLTIVFYIQFINHFLKIKESLPKTYFITKLFIWIALAFTAFLQIVLIYTRNAILIVELWYYRTFFLDVVVIVVILFSILKLKNPLKKYIVISNIIYIGGLFIDLNQILTEESLIHTHLEIAVLLECSVFAIGIGHKVRLIYQQQDEMRESYIHQLKINQEIQRKANSELELKVAERTVEIKQQQEKLFSKNKHLEVLVKEIHHRVKNNLQLISSLLNMQKRRLAEPAAIAAVKDSQNRVQAMALLHQHLYQFEELEQVNFEVYIQELFRSLNQIYQGFCDNIKLNIVGNINLKMDLAIPIGLIINELVTNSIKHAFDENQEGIIEIQFGREANGFSLFIKDNGNNPNRNYTDKNNNPTLGLKLVSSFLDHLQATMKTEAQNGTSHFIIIPLETVSINP
ncbi:histidine kinase dimerization/phosphoacceptor domain -containing protein [Chondrinema litorale]|uniref:histidine kinase dimerization/phosphoacceptor domain -containing protein n=1 Tax=Chondrinema litorale TaxID=2994555 RepID=UPI002543F51F|nr:histidine kinase dimerization/phosphoacceptor domain -containing protein [Chondrinema litorale]UZR98483.1 ATP-binding protein [Chondrinema litorale]